MWMKIQPSSWERGIMGKFVFIPYEFPTSKDGKYAIREVDHQILHSRRIQLGFTQQEVADRACIKLPQYQRLEAGTRPLSGCSMRAGLAICAVLLLDPYEQINVHVDPPDPASMKPQKMVDIRVREEEEK